MRQGFTNALEDSLGDYQAMTYLMGAEALRAGGGTKRMLSVDLAVKGKGAALWAIADR